MPRYDFKCTSETCGHIFEGFVSLAEFPKTLPCEKCDSPTDRVHLPRRVYAPPPAVVVYAAPDGTYRFPGDTDGVSAKQYDQMGYTRIEARGWAEVRNLEGRVNAQQGSEIRRRAERQQELHETMLSRRHSEVRRCLEQGFVMPEYDERGNQTGEKVVRMGAHAQDLMRAAMARNNNKPGYQSGEAGFRVEAYSENRGNRERGRHSDGRRMRD